MSKKVIVRFANRKNCDIIFDNNKKLAKLK